MEVGIVRRVDIDQQMQEAYLDYAMSVIVSRALPDVRDGLKPVHRRILYAMHDMGLRANQPYKKSARIVGEVLGKYHPHGDAAVYEAMVRMAQDFSMRAPLIDGQGNFGSIDGDPPAAMRYTEARMASLANEIMADIDKATVEFVDNFDGSLTEPDVLPTKVPNFLVNGAAGIAVGMATSVPPHNLGEVCDALTFMLEQMAKNKDVGIDDLLKFIKGPDFPTGGIVYRYAGEKASPDGENDLIKTAYAAGRGRITVQAKAHIEEMSRNRHRLVITELPYQTNKSALAEKIAELARDGKIEGLADLRDESDRQGMRLVVELTRTVEPMEVLKQLFKLTPLQSTFSINMLALVEGEPRLLPLKRALQLFIEHRQQVITRRSQYELNQARQRAHILEGLRTALTHLDEVIDTIRRSQSADTARENLRKKFKLSEVQATAILDMPLRRLAALERKKIETEYKEVLARIKYLEDLLKNPKKILGVIKEELSELKAKYDSPRRTTIVDQTANNGRPVTAGDLVPAQAVVVAVSQSGRVCRWPAAEGLEPARGKQADSLAVAVPAHTRDTLYLFTAAGRAIIIPMHQMPIGSGPGDGPSLSEFSSGRVQPIVAGLALSNAEEKSGYVCLVTQQGKVKRVLLSDLEAVRGSEAVVIGLDKGDRLLTTFATPGKGELFLVSAQGQAIRFAEEEVRPMGLPAAGVMGMKLGGNDLLVGAGLVKARGDVALVTRQGVGKRTELSEFPKQGRHGQGVMALKLAAGDSLAAAATVKGADRVMLLSQKGNNKTIFAKSLPKLGRAQKGQELIAIRGRDQVIQLITLIT
ncbi:MAG: DNA gyrase subunit A [Anaerolineales bacterium]|nr:DNA gyrase subunit A [Anaerolineales bacterium]